MRRDRLLLHLVLLLLALLLHLAQGEKKDVHLSWEDKLIKHLLGRYRIRGKYGRPVLHYNESILIRFNMQLIQIMDLDEKNQILTLNVWDRYKWTDIHMQWDPKDWGDVDTIRLPSKKLWVPDLKLYNYADSRLQEHRDALLVIMYNGEILWMPQAIYRSSCVLDVSTFPFDKQQCELKFGSWTYDGNKLDLAVLADNEVAGDQIDLSEYVKSNSWQIMAAPARRNIQYYTCCPEPYVDLKFTLIFQRRSTLYNYILILPCILLTSITLVLFWIPPESPAKLMLGISIFVAFFLLLLLMEANLPPAAANVPLLGTYYCLNMILITLSSFLNAFVVYMSFYGARRPVPRIMKKILFEFFGRILCMDNLVRPHIEQQNQQQQQQHNNNNSHHTEALPVEDLLGVALRPRTTPACWGSMGRAGASGPPRTLAPPTRFSCTSTVGQTTRRAS
ncbi:neuronal acetylcholine receptor subunit alpha-10-like isoform X1 [Pomacea canaliculata]|uniref:neuronal acetylcholine receptor subunit alpha-10-like isoform X1 n=1 Tax=Pomacea canaliculata TaxID=400727 RepID=UPI000D73A788|nr:neuronal acetylcholine receptor subunit alpha-10-like isoform X1 [Pomacea canaliculata]